MQAVHSPPRYTNDASVRLSPRDIQELAPLEDLYNASAEAVGLRVQCAKTLESIKAGLKLKKTQLDAAYSTSRTRHAELVHKPKKLFGFVSLQTGRDDADPKVLKARESFEAAMIVENQLRVEVHEMESKASELTKELERVGAQASEADMRWATLEAYWASLPLPSYSGEIRARIQTRSSTLRASDHAVNKLRDDLANTDRARHAVVSAYVHYSEAEDLTLRSLDSGMFGFKGPDPGRAGLLRDAVFASHATGVCIGEARRVLPADQLPDELALVKHTQHANEIGKLRYLGGPGGDKFLSPGVNIQERVKKYSEGLSKAVVNLRASSVKLQDDVKRVRLLLFDEEQRRVGARRALEDARNEALRNGRAVGLSLF